MKNRFTILFFFIYTFIFAEKYTVISTLHIRSSESKTSQIVGKLEKNELIEGTDLGTGWIKLENGKGFVNSVFVQKEEDSIEKKSFWEDSIEKKPFWETYKESYFPTCAIIAVIFSFIYANFNTKKDRRLKDGYDEKEYGAQMFNGLIIGVVISLPISLVVSLFYTIYIFFFK